MGVHTGFVNIPATYVNENVTKYNVRRIDLAIDPHPIKLKPKEEVKIHFGMDLIKRVPENDDLKVNISVTREGYKIGSVEYDETVCLNLLKHSLRTATIAHIIFPETVVSYHLYPDTTWLRTERMVYIFPFLCLS